MAVAFARVVTKIFSRRVCCDKFGISVKKIDKENKKFGYVR
jgi:hypothetical protein